MTSFLLIICYAILVIVPLGFIFYGVYRDGAFGRISLGGIAFFATPLFVESVFGDGDASTMLVLLSGLAVAFTVFLCWHLARFHSRAARAPERAPCGLVKQIGCPYGAAGPVELRRRVSDRERAFSLRQANGS